LAAEADRSCETRFSYTDVLTKLMGWVGDTPLATVSTRRLDEVLGDVRQEGQIAR
jgi:hypothetical protein